MSTSFPIPRAPGRDPEHPLARAFASFTEAAGSLERTYGHLQEQVVHLRQELEVTNRDLARSLEENHRIRERLRRILERLPCGVLVMESGSKISNLNPAAIRLLGKGCESANALPAAVSEALDRAREIEDETELELAADPSIQAGANSVWVAIRHAWLEQTPEASTSVFILRDVSEEKKLEFDREHLRRRQALVEMSALLAHEIRNPLGSLELFAGLLAEANLEGESQSWIQHVQAGLRTLSATVNNVLHLHDSPRSECALTDMGQLLDWAYGFLLPLAKQARVELQVINGLTGVFIVADRHRLEQVLLNLALNAFRFMPGGGWLSIRGMDCALRESSQGTRDGIGERDEITIQVDDTGPGITAEDLPRIFEAGFSTRAGSSGLGLAVCHRIAEQHGGSITAESKPGSGATFRLCLPRSCTPEESKSGSLPSASAMETQVEAGARP